MNSASAGWHSMFYTHFAAFFGVLIAGKLSDWVGAKGKPAWRTAMQGLGLLVAAPCIYYMGHSASTAIVFGALAIFGFARAFFDANTYVVLYDVIPAKFHSSASGVMIMIGFGTGALAPYILGIIKEASGLSLGFTILAAIWAIGGLIMTEEFRDTSMFAAENMEMTADKLVEYALSIDEETEQNRDEHDRSGHSEGQIEPGYDR